MIPSKSITIDDFGDIVVTMLGESELHTIVINGGPGLSCSYLLEPLEKLSEKRKLIFYDQCGCGKDKTINLITCELMLKQLKALVRHFNLENKGFGIIAHSWGTHLALELLSALKSPCVRELFLINPFPLTKNRYLLSQERLLKRFPNDVINKAKLLINKVDLKSGLTLMDLISPYYLANHKKQCEFNFESYNMFVNKDVIASLSNFSKLEMPTNIPKNSVVFQGKHDFIIKEDIEELIQKVSKYVILENSGHYPFLEQKALFLSYLSNYLKF